MSFKCKQSCCFWMLIFLNGCEKKELSQNITSKIAPKVTRKNSNTVLKPSAGSPRSRLKSMKSLYEHTLKFWIISYFMEFLCVYRVCSGILLHTWNYKKSQYKILRRSLSQREQLKYFLKYNIFASTPLAKLLLKNFRWNQIRLARTQ